ncbi:MAG: hypothetical protein HY865_19465 [Chloroflexi bacterium]|nr:hypothetical protein [Chloroflexota bacterium]
MTRKISTAANDKLPNQIKIAAFVILALGIAMLVYWGMYVFQGMPIAGIPVLSEIINAALGLTSGIGLLRRQKWSIPASIFTGGMWAYGVLGGINLVLEKGLNFSSPFGAAADAILFPLILVFAVYLAVVVWRNRDIYD